MRKQDFAAIRFSEYFKSTREKLCSKLGGEQNIRKVAESLYISLKAPNEVEKHSKIKQSNLSNNCVHHYNIEILNLFYSELQLINN